MNLIKVKDYNEASKVAFDIMLPHLKANQVLGLATGSTPLGLYQLMVEDFKENNRDYSEIISFNLDEYVGLDPKHRESYYSFMNRNLFQYVNFKESHLPSGIGDLDNNCLEYEKLLNQHTIDIQILGIGSDGHIGFNEPGTSFDSLTHVIELTQQTRGDNSRFFKDLNEEVPTHAITMGIASIMKAKEILLIATGENKAEALKMMIEGEINEACPASILQKHDNVTIVYDEKAGKLLGGNMKEVNTNEFLEETKEGLCLVDFSATWCGPCKMMAPILEELSNEISDVKFLKVDVDENNELAAKYGVMSIPCVYLLKDGEVKGSFVGLQPKETVKNFIESHR